MLELIDAPDLDRAELDGNLDDLDTINRWLGGSAPIVRAILESGATSVLDVGSGGADIPRAAVRAARRAGRNLRVVALDRSQSMIDLARARSSEFPEIEFIRADGTSLPFGDAAFDVTISAATLHHLEPPAAVPFLQELRRVARLTPIVGDLRRTPLAFAGARIIAAISTNRLTQNDAPLSVRRSYTPAESLALAQAAGWQHPSVRRTMWFRQLLCDDAN